MEVIFGFSFVYVQIFVNLQSHNQHIYIYYIRFDRTKSYNINMEDTNIKGMKDDNNISQNSASEISDSTEDKKTRKGYTGLIILGIITILMAGGRMARLPTGGQAEAERGAA